MEVIDSEAEKEREHCLDEVGHGFLPFCGTCGYQQCTILKNESQQGVNSLAIDILKDFRNLNATTTVLAGMSWYLRNRVTIRLLLCSCSFLA
jgi:hypothetical protein